MPDWTPLGTTREVQTAAGPIRYRERGDGPTIVFLHGIVANGWLWRRVVPSLSDQFRCITPDWPLGSHELGIRADADLSLPGLARIVESFFDALDLDDVTLVANDTGGAIAQWVAVHNPDRLGRLVLTLPIAFGRLTVRPIDPDAMDCYTAPLRNNPAVRTDFARLVRSISSRYTIEAAEQLRRFDKPALVIWSLDDRLFPLRHAHLLAELLPQGSLKTVSDAGAFIPEDKPRELATLVREFVAGPTSRADQTSAAA